MTTGCRITIAAATVLAVTTYMSYLGAASSWQYYVSVDECLTQSASLVGAPIRVNGKVAPGSLRIAANRKSAAFVLAGRTGHLLVQCEGPLPDNLAEDRQVVVEGRLLDAERLDARRVLTRCASKYASSSGETTPTLGKTNMGERE